jgi:hypothetical protein
MAALAADVQARRTEDVLTKAKLVAALAVAADDERVASPRAWPATSLHCSMVQGALNP